MKPFANESLFPGGETEALRRMGEYLERKVSKIRAKSEVFYHKLTSVYPNKCVFTHNYMIGRKVLC